MEASVQTFSAGQYIKHFQYGCGVIAESDPNHIYGIKKFVTSLMVVERAEGVPPKRPCARRIKKTAPAQVFPGLVLGAK